MLSRTVPRCLAGLEVQGLRPNFSTSSHRYGVKDFKLLVLGGGAGGCSMAAKFASRLGKGRVAVVEPRKSHYYQPGWTMVGAGISNMKQFTRPMADVLPKDAEWIQSSVEKIDADACKVYTSAGDEIGYEYLVIALGLNPDFSKVKGLMKALETPTVCSNYHPLYCENTAKVVNDFRGGNAVFTFPKGPIKCPGAPQKAMYLAERTFVKNGVKDKTNVFYHAGGPAIFGVKQYADSLWKVVEERNINVTLMSNLVEVNPDKQVAIFEKVDAPDSPKTELPYDMLHVGPPHTPPLVLMKNAKNLVNDSGFVEVDSETLQHVRYPNVFGIGDCTNVPCSKTAAAVATEGGVLRKNLTAAMEGRPMTAKYNGYASCPLLVGENKCILAEFDFSKPARLMETMPVDQTKPRWSSYALKAYVMPVLYWMLLRGKWEGPAVIRKILHFGMKG